MTEATEAQGRSVVPVLKKKRRVLAPKVVAVAKVALKPFVQTPTLEIVRYANRKLYAREVKDYVCFVQVYHTIAQGRDVRVMCGVTERDITAYVLGEVFSRVCARRDFVSPQKLMQLLREHGPEADVKKHIPA